MGKWTLMDEHDYRGISLKAYRSHNAPIKDKFDLGIFFGTFESRGLISSGILEQESCAHSIIIFFKESQDKPLRKKYDIELTKQVENCTTSKKVIKIEEVSIKNVEETLEKIIAAIPLECWKLSSSWFIDLGGSPIPYFLGLISYLRDIFPCPALTLFNPTGSYNKQTDGVYTFTSGYDKNIWIPRMWGLPDPTLQKMYVFLLGFNGQRSYEVLYHCEPDQVKAMIANPGYEAGYENEAITENELFLRETGLWPTGNNSPNVMEADAGNPVQVWRQLQQIVNQARGKLNICFIPIGTKAHALGAGICSVADGFPGIIYHMPRTFNVRDTLRGSYLWKYEISL